MFALEIKEARKILDNLVYTGERHPQMYWTKFEQQLNTAFATYMEVEGRVVHFDVMELSSLMLKVKCDSLSAVTAALAVAVQGNPNYSYAMVTVLKVYKAEVGKSGTLYRTGISRLESKTKARRPRRGIWSIWKRFQTRQRVNLEEILDAAEARAQATIVAEAILLEEEEMEEVEEVFIPEEANFNRLLELLMDLNSPTSVMEPGLNIIHPSPSTLQIYSASSLEKNTRC